MKITKQRLKEIIKEEVEEVLKEDLSRLYPKPDPDDDDNEIEYGSSLFQRAIAKEKAILDAIERGENWRQIQKLPNIYHDDYAFYRHLKRRAKKKRASLEEAIALKKPGKNFNPLATKDPRVDIVSANVGKQVVGLGLNDYLRKKAKRKWTAKIIDYAGINTVNPQDGEKAHHLVRIQLSASPEEILKEAAKNSDLHAMLEREGLVKNITVPIDYIDSIRD